MINTLVINKLHLGLKQDLIDLTPEDVFTANSGLTMQMIQKLNFLIITDEEAGIFWYAKSRDCLLDRNAIHPIDYLTKHLEYIAFSYGNVYI